MNAPRNKDLQIARRLRGQEDSEFGRGFVQQLLYFQEHFGRIDVQKLYVLNRVQKGRISKEDALDQYPDLSADFQIYGDECLENRISLFMNVTSDHLYDFEIPDNIPEEIQKKARELRDLALEMGHGKGLLDRSFCTIERFETVRQLVLDVARMIDVLVFDVTVDEGEYT